eukprot:469546-Rhodomonas_salina.2
MRGGASGLGFRRKRIAPESGSCKLCFCGTFARLIPGRKQHTPGQRRTLLRTCAGPLPEIALPEIASPEIASPEIASLCRWPVVFVAARPAVHVMFGGGIARCKYVIFGKGIRELSKPALRGRCTPEPWLSTSTCLRVAAAQRQGKEEKKKKKRRRKEEGGKKACFASATETALASHTRQPVTKLLHHQEKILRAYDASDSKHSLSPARVLSGEFLRTLCAAEGLGVRD